MALCKDCRKALSKEGIKKGGFSGGKLKKGGTCERCGYYKTR